MSNEESNSPLSDLSDFVTQPVLPSIPDTSEDTNARKEDAAYYHGNLLCRRDRMDGARHGILYYGIWLAFFTFAGVLLIRACHLVFPECWRWLTAEEVQSVDKIIFSGAIGGAVGRYLDKAVDRKKD